MIYICSNSEYIKNYWDTHFGNNYKIVNIELSEVESNSDFNNDDLLILDLSQFTSIDEQMESFCLISSSLKVIALLDEPKLAHGAYLIKKGFKSYLGKKTNNIIVKQVVKTVVDGNVWLYPELMNYIIKHISINTVENQSSEALDKLSTKERLVANFVADGLSNKEISKNMEVQLVTVKKHIGNIFTKLQIKDRVALAILINK